MRWGLSALVVVLVAGGLSPAGVGASPSQEGDAPAGEPVEWWDDLTQEKPAEPEAPPFVQGEPAPLEADSAGDVPSVELPVPGVSEVSLGDEGDARAIGDTAIDIAAASAAVEGADLQVEVLDREVTEPAGVSAFALRVSGAGGGSLAAAAEAADAGLLPVELKVDTSGWEDLYGADYPSRIVAVALPDCALEDPPPAGCDRNGVPVPSHLNAETGEIVIEVDDLSALDSATLESDEAPLGPPVQVDDFSGNVPVAHETAPVPSGDDSEAAATRPGPSGGTGGEPAEPTDAGGSSAGSTTTPTTTSTSPASTSTPSTTSTTAPTAETGAETGAGTVGLQGRASDPASGVAGFEGAAAHARSGTSGTSGTTGTSGTSGTSGTARAMQVGGGSAVVALTSSPASEGGNWGATSLNLSGDWLVGIGSGEFSWSYDIPMPPAPGGATPQVGLSYSSASVDGLVTGRNVQAGQAGLGWSDFANAFIERRYAPCDEDEVFHDLCWRQWNATISLGGRQSELVPVQGTSGWQSWVLKDDPRWRVQRRNDFVPNGDNDGENWRVTTPDGTEYWFGIGVDPVGGATGSVWTVPVFANDTGEPCRGEGGVLAWCNQAWRWNLDRVVDPDGNITVYRYVKETNKYGILNGWGDASYNNGGRLVMIEYGLHEATVGSGPLAPAARVAFDAGYRCNHLDEGGPCPVPTKDNGNYYKDVPSEFICDVDCLVVSPTFFSTKRYTEVRTSMRVNGTYEHVDEIRLRHSMADEEEGNKNLWLKTIQRVGLVGPGVGIPLPAVAFHGIKLPNRVDYAPSLGRTPMYQYRVNEVLEEYGRDIQVHYDRPNGCEPGTNPHTIAGWDDNALSCFPQLWRPPGATEDEIAVFHKWLVHIVEVNDTTGASVPIVTTYDYGGTPAWHFNDDDFLNNDKKTWSDWRGYLTARVTVGAGPERMATRYRLFRGMNGDHIYPHPTGGVQTWWTESFDGSVVYLDQDWMKGRILDEQRIDVDDNRLSSTLTQYVSEVTSELGGEAQDDAHWVGPALVTNSYRRTDGTFARTRTETTYNLSSNPTGPPGYVANYMPREVVDYGWLHEIGDERCTHTSYANNPGLGMYGFPKDQYMTAGIDCDTTPTASMSRRQQWHYDGGALGDAPTVGHVTKTRALKDAAAGAWLGYTQTGYDALGRPTSVTDPNSHTTTTAYTPTTGNPTSSVVTNHLGHTSTTSYMVERGLPVAQVDANGKATYLVYDALGRLVQVYRPSEVPFVNNASLRFSYDVDAEKDAPPVIRSQTLVNDTGPDPVYQDTWAVYDGLLRQRQTHQMSPVTGRVIVQDTLYDSKGHVEWTALPEAVPGTAGSGILAPAGDKRWANVSRPTYDELGRVTRDTFYGVDTAGTTAVERWHTDTTYDFNQTTVDPPVGASTVTTTDAYGRVTSVAEDPPISIPQPPGSPPLTVHTTSYDYNVAGDLLTVTDPEDNVISYGYDNAGRRTSQDDPDAGAWTYTYDDVGNQLTVTDALSHTITTDYDQLNRPTLRHEGTTNLASWTYDASGQKGLLDKSTRFVGSETWITDIVDYDIRNRPTATKLTVPASITGLAGDYTTSYGYDQADHPTSIAYPAVGGLPAETVNTSYYESLGLPAALVGAGTDLYALWAVYDDRARPETLGFGLYGGQFTLGRHWTYNADQRLQSVSNANSDGTVELARHDIVYDPVGNITQRTTKLGTDQFRECFTYDPYQRLTRAVTTTTSTDCSTDPATPSGNLPYEQDFTHSDDGNLTSRDDGTGAVSYTYPASGTPRPHAPTTVGPNTYQWDANGNLDTRTVGGVTTNFTFDHEHNLASASSPAGTSEFVYDANGQRLYQKTPTGSTLYLEGQEVNATPGATPTVTATRLYTFAGQLVATRTAADGVDYLVTDHQGSVEAKLDAAGTTVSARRAYKPYGQPRTTDTFATQRGWIGQIQDTTTGLDYLNARYYDPNISRFISPDPLYNTTQPKSLNPYTYAWGNPTTGTDPSGLLRDCECYNHPQPSPPPSSPGCGCGGGAAGPGGGTGNSSGGGGAGSHPSSSDTAAIDEALQGCVDFFGGYDACLMNLANPQSDTPFSTLSDLGHGLASPFVAIGESGRRLWECGVDIVHGDARASANCNGDPRAMQAFAEDPLGAIFGVCGSPETEGAYFAGCLISNAALIVGGIRGLARSGPGVLDDAAFAQTTFRESFSAGGRFAGQTIDDVAGGLRSGAMSTSDVPIQYIVREGNTLILNTRSAQALMRAGIPRSEWLAINMTGDAAAEARLTAQLSRNGLDHTGTRYPISTGG